MIQSSLEFTETYVWNYYKIEGISRSTVFRSYNKIINGCTVNKEPKFDRNLYKLQPKKEQDAKKISIKLELVTKSWLESVNKGIN